MGHSQKTSTRNYTGLVANVLIPLLLLPLLAWPTLSYAAEDHLTPEYKKCTETHIDNAGWARCGKEEVKRQESFLADAWKKASDDMKEYASWNKDSMCKGCGEEAIASLNEEQENWNKWKDSACKYFISGLYGSETEVLAYPSCKASIIADRVMTLRQLSKGIKEAMQH